MKHKIVPSPRGRVTGYVHQIPAFFGDLVKRGDELFSKPVIDHRDHFVYLGGQHVRHLIPVHTLDSNPGEGPCGMVVPRMLLEEDRTILLVHFRETRLVPQRLGEQQLGGSGGSAQRGDDTSAMSVRPKYSASSTKPVPITGSTVSGLRVIGVPYLPTSSNQAQSEGCAVATVSCLLQIVGEPSACGGIRGCA
jgi:hypothetical protein